MRSLTSFEMTQPVIPNAVRNPIKNTVIPNAVRNPMHLGNRIQIEISHFVRDDAPVIPNAVRNPIISDIRKQNEILTLFNMILSISRCLHQPKPNYLKAVLVTIPSTRPCSRVSPLCGLFLVLVCFIKILPLCGIFKIKYGSLSLMTELLYFQ